MSKPPYGKANFRKDTQELDEDGRLRLLTFALFRQHGRVRIRAEDMAALGPYDVVDMHTDPATGDVLVTYTAGASEEPGGPPALGGKLH